MYKLVVVVSLSHLRMYVCMCVMYACFCVQLLNIIIIIGTQFWRSCT